MRVCMEPRLLPGVRCSVLKTVKSWPSCWMTMPGRSCVALTLLICSLRVSISKIQAGQEAAPSGMTRGTPGRSPDPARANSIDCRIPSGQSGSSCRCAGIKRDCASGVSALCGGSGHPGVVYVDQHPAPGIVLPIDLRLPAVSRHRGPVASQLGVEVPVELSPRGVTVHMHSHVANPKFALRKNISHHPLIDVLLDFFPAVLMTKRVDEGNIR